MEKLKVRPEKASDATRLSDLGITYDQSSQWQKLARVPDDQLELALAGQERSTTNGIINAAFPPEPSQWQKRRRRRLADFCGTASFGHS
jgi:hypothetical protein